MPRTLQSRDFRHQAAEGEIVAPSRSSKKRLISLPPLAIPPQISDDGEWTLPIITSAQNVHAGPDYHR
jgi:hypothetical protein